MDTIGLLQESVKEFEDGVYLVNGDCEITFWNESAQRLTGFEKREAEGRRCERLLRHSIARGGVPLCGAQCPLEESMNYRRPAQADLWMRTAFGDEEWKRVWVRTLPLCDADGRKLGGIQFFSPKETTGKFSSGIPSQRKPSIPWRTEPDPILRDLRARSEAARDVAVGFMDRSFRRRQSSSLVLTDDEFARITVTIECDLPSGKPLEPRSFPFVAPLFIAAKGQSPRDLTVLDHRGARLPYLAGEEVAGISRECLAHVVEAYKKAPIDSRESALIYDVVGMGDGAIPAAHFLAGKIGADEAVFNLAYALARGCPVLAILPSEEDGRRVIQYSHAVAIPVPEAGSWRASWNRLKAGAGLKSHEMDLELGTLAGELTASVASPLRDEIACRIGDESQASESAGSTRPRDSGQSSLVVCVDVEPQRRLLVMAAAVSLLFILFALVSSVQNALSNWQKDAGAAVPLLLALGVPIFAFLVRPDQGVLARYLLGTLKRISMLVAGIIFVAGITLAGKATPFWLYAYWWLSAGVFAGLSLALWLGRRRVLKKRRS